MSEIAVWRLYLLRAAYLLLLVGLGTVIWPHILDHKLETPLDHGVVASLLGAMGMLAALGMRYPLKMLPLLFFELSWKCIWLLAYALPLYRAGQMDDDTRSSVFDCSLVVIILVVIPWDYVWKRYVVEKGDRWWKIKST